MVCRKTGIPHCSCHSFRHTFISNLIRKGVPLPVIEKVSGDTQKTIFERYSHMFEDDDLADWARELRTERTKPNAPNSIPPISMNTTITRQRNRISTNKWLNELLTDGQKNNMDYVLYYEELARSRKEYSEESIFPAIHSSIATFRASLLKSISNSPSSPSSDFSSSAYEGLVLRALENL